MKKRLAAPATALAVSIALGFAPRADAILMLSADVSGTLFSCVDQAACDTSLAVGTLQVGTPSTPLTLNGVDFFGSLSVASTIPGDPDVHFLSSSSLQIINTSGATRVITFAVGATDFVGPADHFDAAGSGTFLNSVGTGITMNWFNDPNNAQGAEAPTDTPGDLLHTFAFVGSANPAAFSTTQSGLVDDPANFSMTLQFNLTLDGDGRLVSLGQSLVKEGSRVVPEPASLALLGVGLLGLVAARRARRSLT